MDTPGVKQHVLTNGFVEFQEKPASLFHVYNHRPQVDKPVVFNLQGILRLAQVLPKWQECLKNTQNLLDQGLDVPDNKEAEILQVHGRNALHLYVQVYNEKAYLWLKTFYLSRDEKPDWLPARGGLMLSYEDDSHKLAEFASACAAKK